MSHVRLLQMCDAILELSHTWLLDAATEWRTSRQDTLFVFVKMANLLSYIAVRAGEPVARIEQTSRSMSRNEGGGRVCVRACV